MLLKYLIFILSVLTLFMGINGQTFRFDYSYSAEAGGWLKFHEVPSTWNDARQICHAEGAVLASPLNLRLKNAIIQFLWYERTWFNYIYTGVHTNYAKGVYASIEGVPLRRMPIAWENGQPDNLKNAESCLVMSTRSNGLMADVGCSELYPFVCYKEKTSDLVFNDCGTTDAAYIKDPRTGTCYKFHREALPWAQAARTCLAEGGYLIIINSVAESQVVRDLFAQNPDHTIMYSFFPYHAYIGLYNFQDGGGWLTVHGQTVTEAGYSTWHFEGNNGTVGGEWCGATHRDNGELYDAPCSASLAYICEMDPPSLV